MEIGNRASLASRFSLVFYLARRELSRRYAGTLLGPAWALVFPVLQITLYWAVFRFGLQIRTQGDLPFAVMLIAGVLPWFALSEALTTMTASVRANSAIVKRTALPVELLPLSSLAAAAFAHLPVVIVAMAMLWLLGFPPDAHILLLLYAAPALALFAWSLGTLLALANAAFSDVAQGIGPALLLWFWATPILWQARMLPAGWRSVVSFNPATHLVEAYRYALLGPRAGGLDPAAASSFWVLTLALLLAAGVALRRFKREVGDLL